MKVVKITMITIINKVYTRLDVKCDIKSIKCGEEESKNVELENKIKLKLLT